MARKPREMQEWPQLFHDALDTLKNGQKEWVFPCSRQTAFTRKTQFYRFFDAIRYWYKQATPEERFHTGLDVLYRLANNVVPSAVYNPVNGEWYIKVRVPEGADNIIPLSAAEQRFLSKATKQLQKDRLNEDEQVYQRIAAGSTIDTKEELLEKADRGELSFEEMFGAPPKNNI